MNAKGAYTAFEFVDEKNKIISIISSLRCKSCILITIPGNRLNRSFQGSVFQLSVSNI